MQDIHLRHSYVSMASPIKACVRLLHVLMTSCRKHPMHLGRSKFKLPTQPATTPRKLRLRAFPHTLLKDDLLRPPPLPPLPPPPPPPPPPATVVYTFRGRPQLLNSSISSIASPTCLVFHNSPSLLMHLPPPFPLTHSVASLSHTLGCHSAATRTSQHSAYYTPVPTIQAQCLLYSH